MNNPPKINLIFVKEKTVLCYYIGVSVCLSAHKCYDRNPEEKKHLDFTDVFVSLRSCKNVYCTLYVH